MKWDTATESCMRKGAIHETRQSSPIGSFIFLWPSARTQSRWYVVYDLILLHHFCLLLHFIIIFLLILFFFSFNVSSYASTSAPSCSMIRKKKNKRTSSRWEKWICYNIQMSRAWHFIKRVICIVHPPFLLLSLSQLNFFSITRAHIIWQPAMIM